MTFASSSSFCSNDLQLNYPWITTSLFEKLMRKDHKSNEIIVVNQYLLVPALNKGENYASQMIRAKVDYTVNDSAKRRMNFVIKAQLTNAPKSFRQNESFSREIAVFENVIPLAEALLKGIGDNTKFSAKCYEANTENYFLVFEDLATVGYKNADRKIGLTMDHYKSTFVLLAKWHATTAMLMQTKTDIMLPFMNKFSSTFYEAFLKSITKTAAQFTKECLPGYEKITKKVEALSEVIFQKIQKSMERAPSDFNCLCHIDLWTNNVMFNDSLPSRNKALLIDFQMVYIGSPVLDLCYSLFTSSDLSIREKEFEELLSYYHGELSSMLKKLGYKKEIPTLEAIQSQMLGRGIFGVPLGLFETVGRYAQVNEENELELLVSESDEGKAFRLNRFKNLLCREKVLFLLNYFDSKGYFDIGVECG